MQALLNVPAEFAPARPLPMRRHDLVVRPMDGGRHVVKDPLSGNYFELGEEEFFLFDRLDGVSTAPAVSAQFESRFGASLSEGDIQEFTELAKAQGFVRAAATTEADGRSTDTAGVAAPAPKVRRTGGSLLYWRVRAFDPDRLFGRVAPRIGFVWTRAFGAASALFIVFAAGVVWANWGDLVSRFSGALRWETAVIVWVTLLATTTLHEFAHGLTCKRFGGDVREVGFLLLFFVPGMYCNVSDSWLFRERWKRVLVTLAGGWCDLCLWALAVIVWRVTMPDCLPNYLAWVMITVLSARLLFNFNPLLKLDGYYLASDLLAVPNLHQRGLDRFKRHLRRLLWGGPGPEPDARGRLLTAFGLVSWAFSAVFLTIMLITLFRFIWARWGVVAFAVVVPLGAVTGRGVFSGLAGKEMRHMFIKLHKRTVCWLGVVFSGLLAILIIPMEDRVSGPFQVRSATRSELRAPLNAFVREVYFDEGQRVSAGEIVARLDIPDLESRTARMRAEVGEATAKLKLLRVGAKPEEVHEQRQRVQRAREWRDLAQQDLGRARAGTQEELSRLDKLVAQYDAELAFAKKAYDRVLQLRNRGNASEVELQETGRELEVYRSKVEQARAQHRSLQAVATREAEAELAKRTKELGDAEGLLTLLEAGSRPEEIAAAEALLTRAKEELSYLESLSAKLLVRTPTDGIVVTPRLREKAGQYLHEGDLLCEVEDPGVLEAEIVLTEQDVSRVRAGYPVEMKPRALPFETFASHVDRIAPKAARLDAALIAQTGTSSTAAPQPPQKPDAPGSVIAYCRLENHDPELRSGMTGFARISCGRRSIGEVMYNRLSRFIRTEFWW